MKNSKSQILNSKLKGQAMLLTVLILAGSMLGASTIAGYLMLLKIRGASDITNSAKAIFAADAGVEWELYKTFKDSNYPPPTLSNGASFTVIEDGQIAKSIGQSNNIFRAFELNLEIVSSTIPKP